MIHAPNFSDLDWLDHGFGLRDSVLPPGVQTVKQIHSGIVLHEPFVDEHGAGREGDALVSGQPGVLVGVKTADCVPVLLVDASTRVVAAIHAGWRGTAENIAATAVNELVVRWQTRVENLRAAIGPSIGVCCYEVGPEVARHFGTWVPEMGSASLPVHLDLPAINEIQLRAAGVPNVWISGECTYCAVQRFFSFRRDRDQAGRMVSFIGLQKDIGRILVDPPEEPSDV